MPRRRVNPLTQPVVALDIDGTLGKYHEQLRWFAELYTGREIRSDWKDEYKGSFSKALGLSKPLYREIKLAYRQSGLKRAMEPFSFVSELASDLRREGFQIWICTTRPYQRLDNVDPDTKHWLKRNDVVYDHLLFGPQKYRDLATIVGKERVSAVFDDLPEQHAAAKRVVPGAVRVMRWGHHNDWYSRSMNGQTFRDSGEFEYVVHDSRTARTIITEIGAITR